MIETWQADPDGKFGTDFRGFGRSATDDEGAWHIDTLKPGRIGDGQAPHIDVSVFARGMLNRWSPGSTSPTRTTGATPCWQSVPEDRRATLIAEPGPDGYRFDVHLQGDGETVFFADLSCSAPCCARGGAAEAVAGRAWLEAMLDVRGRRSRARRRDAG